MPIYDDVREVTGGRLRADGIPRIDVITGGFPCQDISQAGKQVGIDGERSGLWSELARIIGEVRPRYAVLENVAALLSGDSGRWFERVLGDLAEIGYDCEWHCIPAANLGAPHRRDRIWIISYPHSDVEQKLPRLAKHIKTTITNVRLGSLRTVADTLRVRQSGSGKYVKRSNKAPGIEGKTDNAVPIGIERQWCFEPDVGRVANGIPRRVDRLKGLGNAIVPQVAEVIFRAIEEST